MVGDLICHFMEAKQNIRGISMSVNMIVMVVEMVVANLTYMAWQGRFPVCSTGDVPGSGRSGSGNL